MRQEGILMCYSRLISWLTSSHKRGHINGQLSMTLLGLFSLAYVCVEDTKGGKNLGDPSRLREFLAE